MGPRRGYTIVISVGEHTDVGPILELASALVPLPEPGDDSTTGRVLLVRVLEVPTEVTLSAAVRPARQERQSLQRLQRLRRPPHVELRTLVRVSRAAWEPVLEVAEEEGANLILLPWEEWSASNGRADAIDQIARRAFCDVAVARPAGLAESNRVLVPVRGGPHAALALRLGAALAERANARLTALHVDRSDLPDDDREREREEFAAVLNVAPDSARDRIEARTVRAPASNLRSLLEREVHDYQLIVMGAPASAPGAPLVLGPIAELLMDATSAGVVVVRTRLPGTATYEEWGPLSAREPGWGRGRPPAPISEVVDRWFAENTFDSSEFERIDELVALKRRQGLTISLALPALNEEETVADVIRAVKTELMDRHPLLDEMVLVDSNSTDRTREIARELGIPVVIHQEVLPELGAIPGKGEALWKSLHVLTGDIIAWIDTDIRNPHPRFVYGLIGPLLKEPRIQYVKGFYNRPIKSGNRIQSTGGGRVTELTARPLLNTFYPELSGLIQPLAGEYAGRRRALERVPFFSGYGVETGLLIDLVERFGLQAIGQVDLKRRVHRNQALPSLSRMAFTILQVVLGRYERSGRLTFAAELSHSMKLIHRDRDRFHLEERQLGDVERPPMIEVPAYLARREALEGQVEAARSLVGVEA